MDDPATTFDEDYFIRGKEKGVSLYENYRWLPQLTVPMAEALAAHMGCSHGDSILDFGCARGYLVRAFQQLGFNAIGYDPSKWAIANCDPAAKYLVTDQWQVVAKKVDWVVAKDVLEHIPENHLIPTIQDLLQRAHYGMFIVVPLAVLDTLRRYAVPEYEKDLTHLIRWTYDEWMHTLQGLCGSGWRVHGTTRVKGIKDNYYDEYPTGNGFFLITHRGNR